MVATYYCNILHVRYTYLIACVWLAVTNADKQTRLRNGVQTATQTHRTPTDGESFAAYTARMGADVQISRGLHESMDYYDDCTTRRRNTSESCVPTK